MVFRRGAAAGESRTFQLGGIEPNGTYQIESYDGSKKAVGGFELKDWTVTLKPRSFQVVFYQRQ